MKNFLVVMLTTLSLTTAYALPLGNPVAASLYTDGLFCEGTACCNPCDPSFSWCDAWSVRVGFYGDYVFDRNLEYDSGMNREVRRAQLYTNAGYLALNICNRLDLFTTLGATTLTVRQDFAEALALLDLPYATDFSWSLGGRVTLWECNCFGIGFEGQYFRTNTTLSQFSATLFPSVHFPAIDVSYSEWQLGLGAAYAFALSCPDISLVPYSGVTYSNVHLDGLITSDPLPDAHNSKDWAWVLGTTLTLCNSIGVTVEGRFAGESAVHVNGQFRF